MGVDVSRLVRAVDAIPDVRATGRIRRAVGLALESLGPPSRVGELVEIRRPGASPLVAEIVGFKGRHAILLPLGSAEGIAPGTPVVSRRHPLRVPVGPGLLGRVLDGLGRPMDDAGPVDAEAWYPVDRPAPDP